MITRRGLLGGFAGLLAAPAIVRVASLMPVRRPILSVTPEPSHMYFLNTDYLGTYKRYSGYEVLSISPQSVISAASYSIEQTDARISMRGHA